MLPVTGSFICNVLINSKEDSNLLILKDKVLKEMYMKCFFCEFPSDMTVAISANLFFFLHLSLTLIIHFSSERTKELLFKVKKFDNSVV